MPTTNENMINKINNNFDNTSYSEFYSNDIWFTILIFIIVICIAVYFFIVSVIKSYKSSWQQNKCNPLFMPFASIINSEESKGTELDYIINNFNECLNTLNAELAQEAKKPIDDLTISMEQIFGSIYAVFIQIQNFIIYLYELILEFFQVIMTALGSLLMKVKYLFININNFLGKTLSMITVVYYTLILLLRLFRLMFTVFVLGWLMTMVLPASLSVVGLLVVVVILVLLLVILNAIPIAGSFIVPIVIGILIPFYVSYHIALIFLLLVTILYALFNDFANKLL